MNVTRPLRLKTLTEFLSKPLMYLEDAGGVLGNDVPLPLPAEVISRGAARVGALVIPGTLPRPEAAVP